MVLDGLKDSIYSLHRTIQDEDRVEEQIDRLLTNAIPEVREAWTPEENGKRYRKLTWAEWKTLLSDWSAHILPERLSPIDEEEEDDDDYDDEGDEGDGDGAPAEEGSFDTGDGTGGAGAGTMISSILALMSTTEPPRLRSRRARRRR